jgi:hypothetical protein
MGHTIAPHPKEDLGAGATVKTANGEVKSRQQMYEEGQSQAQGIKENGVGAAQEQIDDVQQLQDFNSLPSNLLAANDGPQEC